MTRMVVGLQPMQYARKLPSRCCVQVTHALHLIVHERPHFPIALVVIALASQSGRGVSGP